MRMRLNAATAVLSVSATAAQAGDVEWTRRRGGAPPRDQLAFAGGGRVGGLEARSLRRPRSTTSLQTVSTMQLNEVLVSGASEYMDYKRRSVTRNLFGEKSREMSGWMTTLRNLDGPEMPFDEMVEAWDDADRLMHVSRERRQRRLRRAKHFDLRRNPSLLTKTEEIELGRKVQELLRWERVRAFLETRLGRPATMEEWAEELGAMDGVEGVKREIKAMKAARERMISCNLRLVLHIARKKFYAGSSGTLKVSMEDMIQDGTAGLVKAVERFDPEKGFRFSTYATWWVHQGIHCGFADCGRVIRLPMNLHTQVCKVARLQAAMVDQLGREPTVEELVLESGLDKRTVEKCLCVSKVEPISLDGELQPREGHLHFERKRGHLGENVVSMSNSVQESQSAPVDGADVTLLKGDVATILGDLSAREAYVLKMRFGLGGSSPSTLASVGRQLNLSRERVRQIQLAAIQKLRGRSLSHEVLYSDRAVAGGKDPATITSDGCWEDEGEEEEGAAGERYGGLPPSVLIDLVKQALEPREGEMQDSEGRVVTVARRRLMRQSKSAQMRRAAAAAALSGNDDAPSAAAAGEGSKTTKKRGFVMKRPYSQRPRTRNGEGQPVAGDVAGACTGTATRPAPPPAQQEQTAASAWQPSLQAA
eukprot:g11097.t1